MLHAEPPCPLSEAALRHVARLCGTIVWAFRQNPLTLHPKERQMPNVLVVNNSVELFRFLLEDIVLVKADGNYADFYIVGDGSRKMIIQLGQVERLFREQIGDGATNFIRVGRKYIINNNYIYHIDLKHQVLVLRDRSYKKYTLDDVSVDALRKLMQLAVGVADMAMERND